MTRKRAVVLVLAALMAATTVFPASVNAATLDDDAIAEPNWGEILSF